MKNPATLINASSGDVELYTPPAIIEAARTAMGGIDLDPASCEIANQTVKAHAYWTALEDGLKQEWHGRVWMNHPFGKSERPCASPCDKKTCRDRGYHRLVYKPGNADWINKLDHEYRIGHISAACCITFAATSEAWFRPLLERPQCDLVPRTNYLTPDGKVAHGVTKGSVVTYFGTDVWNFYLAFRELGVIHVPYKLTA